MKPPKYVHELNIFFAKYFACTIFLLNGFVGQIDDLGQLIGQPEHDRRRAACRDGAKFVNHVIELGIAVLTAQSGCDVSPGASRQTNLAGGSHHRANGY